MSKNILLFLIVLSYLYPLYYIFIKYNSQTSVSSILCNEECRKIISKCMLIMCLFLLFYELKRYKIYSLVSIIGIILCINILINTNEGNVIHFYSATLCIIFMVVFMFINFGKSFSLKFLFALQLLFILILFFDLIIGNKIFMSECLVFATFGIYFFLLHFIEIKLI